jgi:hypothetical protein
MTEAQRQAVEAAGLAALNGDDSPILSPFTLRRTATVHAAAVSTEPAVTDTATPEPSIEIVGAASLVANHPQLNPPVVDGLLREGETMNLIASSKAGKSWLAWSLGLSVGTGRLWLERFAVEQGRVLYVDAELHRSTISKRITAVADAMNIDRAEALAAVDIVPLRGRLRDIIRLGTFFRSVAPGTYKIVVLDALYRLIPPGVDENSNSDMTGIYNLVDQYADRMKAAIVIVHHASKGMQGGKQITDVGAGAGALSRATDSHLVMRPHVEDDAVCVEAAVRSFKPVEPFCLRWNFPLWVPANDLDPADVRTEVKRKPKAEDPNASAPWTPDRVAVELVGDGPEDRNLVLSRGKLVGLTRRMVEDLLRLAIDKGLVHIWPKGKTNAILIGRKTPPLTRPNR